MGCAIPVLGTGGSTFVVLGSICDQRFPGKDRAMGNLNSPTKSSECKETKSLTSKAPVLVKQNQNKTKCRAGRKTKESSFRLHGTSFQGTVSAFFLAVDSLVLSNNQLPDQKSFGNNILHYALHMYNSYILKQIKHLDHKISV